MADASRELDAAVHRACGKACERRAPTLYPDGPDWCEWCPIESRPDGTYGVWEAIPDYSSDPAAALAALEAFCEHECRDARIDRRRNNGPAYRWDVRLAGADLGDADVQADGDTLPLAACRAILAAAGEGGGG